MYEDQPHHQLILKSTAPTGVEEWYCPTCGRRFLMQWPPDYKKIVLEPGDEYAIHSGGKGGLFMGATETFANDDTNHRDQAYLAPWLEWMEKSGFENLWNQED